MHKLSQATILPFLVVMVLQSCSTVPGAAGEAMTMKEDQEITKIQEDLIDSAQWALGRKSLEINGRKFNMDCSGVVMAVYYKAEIDLQPFLRSYSGGGVQRLYEFMEDRQLLYKQPHLEPGDLLFWDNTYDQNGDGKINDTLTHIGMVVSIDDGGNILFIHYNYRKGIVLAKMNLLSPDDLKRNSPIRARGAEKGHATLWLSSQLLKQAARAYELKKS
ncbi:NlpC/P60 family protein [Oceanispirochaeta sp.]|jgi:hypothetical protein|uniref:NlpC/P60 family protein n=1 Tax=Oceanispirochaeta sp. TaxID=2035350 RepID=UPI002627294F|nr:NlpC/P60 family protein [Oceanispirochaeta sp.]MDA3956668.1 NlpC/P60 family protein [Oceanispirochaeta sp.]